MQPRSPGAQWAARVATGVAAASVVAGATTAQVFEHKQSAAKLAWELLAFAAVCGIASYGLIEIVKRLLPIRAYVQRSFLRHWIFRLARNTATNAAPTWREFCSAMNVNSNDEPGTADEIGSPDQTVRAERRLDARSRAIFGLPAPALGAQIANAMEAAIETPREYPHLIEAFTRPADAVQRVRAYLETSIQAHQRQESSAAAPSLTQDAVNELARGDKRGSGLSAPGLRRLLHSLGNQKSEAARLARDLDEIAAASEVRVDTKDAGLSLRSSFRLRSNLDALQIALTNHWRTATQASAVILAWLVGLVVQVMEPSTGMWLFIAAAAAIGGPVAWTVRDITASIERLRRA